MLSLREIQTGSGQWTVGTAGVYVAALSLPTTFFLMMRRDIRFLVVWVCVREREMEEGK